MLKKIRGLFLGLVVLAGSACVTPTHASSASSVIITSVQASGVSGAKEELVTIYNNSTVDVNVTGWCLTNKADVAFACFGLLYDPNVAADAMPSTAQYILPAYSAVTVASKEYVTQNGYDPQYFSLVYEVTNGVSGSIVSSTDTITLIDTEGVVMNSTSWPSTLVNGKAWERLKILSGPDVYAANNDSNDWSVVGAGSPPLSGLSVQHTPRGTEGPAVDEPMLSPPRITELLPNPDGVDAGREFIELYNPNDATLSLKQYKIRIGIDSFKWYDFPADSELPPHTYGVFFSDRLGGFTLPNTKGDVQLFKDETAVGDYIHYEAAKDDTTWALFGELWEYTTVPTPGAENQRPIVTLIIKPSTVITTNVKKPCAANQYRNPETGRCKLIASNTTTPTPCKEGQERNPETHRCRTIAKPTEPTPCKVGQERNPETHRCRTITKMTDAGYAVKGMSTKGDTQTSWYYWLGIGAIAVLVMGYAVWEWRQELLAMWRRLCGLFARQ